MSRMLENKGLLQSIGLFCRAFWHWGPTFLSILLIVATPFHIGSLYLDRSFLCVNRSLLRVSSSLLCVGRFLLH